MGRKGRRRSIRGGSPGRRDRSYDRRRVSRDNSYDRRDTRRRSRSGSRGRDGRKRRRSSSESPQRVVSIPPPPEWSTERLSMTIQEMRALLGNVLIIPQKVLLATSLRDYMEGILSTAMQRHGKDVWLYIIGGWSQQSAMPLDHIDFGIDIAPSSRRGRHESSSMMRDLSRVHDALVEDTFRDLGMVDLPGEVPYIEKATCEPNSGRMIDMMRFTISIGADRIYASGLVSEYSASSLLVPELVRVMKRWARNLGFAPKLLSSFKISLMVIYFLLKKKVLDWINPRHVTMQSIAPVPNPSHYRMRTPDERARLHFILPSLFKFYAYEFDYENTVLSLWSDEEVRKDDPQYRDCKFHNRYFHIEDPSNRAVNLTNNLPEQHFSVLLDAFQATSDALDPSAAAQANPAPAEAASDSESSSSSSSSRPSPSPSPSRGGSVSTKSHEEPDELPPEEVVVEGPPLPPNFRRPCEENEGKDNVKENDEGKDDVKQNDEGKDDVKQNDEGKEGESTDDKEKTTEETAGEGKDAASD